jgi:glycosyltransferase involved in cell wall biosynthesis
VLPSGSTYQYAFVQQGPFSHVNSHLSRELAPLLGNPFVVDVADHRRLGPGVLLNGPPDNLAALLRERGVGAVLHPLQCLRERTITERMFSWRSDRARSALTHGIWQFILQTQTMFDASMDGVPFFVYTDHTVLANARYPGGYPTPAWSAGWVVKERAAYRRADHIFVASEFTRSSLIEDYDCHPARISVVGSAPNVLPSVEGLERLEPRASGVPTILFVGIDWQRKGGPVLLKALRQLRTTHPDVVLRVVGCNPRVSQPGVQIVGRLPRAGVLEELRKADIFCMPSWVEPAAVVYLEAAACGLPVVATRVGATPERVLDGQTGYLCPPGDSECLAQRLRQLLDHPEESREMGARGIQAVRELTWPAIAAQISSEIRAMLPPAG